MLCIMPVVVMHSTQWQACNSDNNEKRTEQAVFVFLATIDFANSALLHYAQYTFLCSKTRLAQREQIGDAN